MSVDCSPFGVLPSGDTVNLYTLKNEVLTVVVTDFGARIISVIVHGRDIVHGPKSWKQVCADTCYCGAICGRVANRIAQGKFSLNGEQYSLAINNGPNHLHGGIVGFDQKLWELIELDEEACSVAFHLISPDGEEAYPGEVDVIAVYKLEGDALVLTLYAEGATKPTILNLTNHVYWNLDGVGTIDAHGLSCVATAYTPKDDTGIPDGRILPVMGTAFDLRECAVLGERNSAAYPEVAVGYDHNFVLPTDAGITYEESEEDDLLDEELYVRDKMNIPIKAVLSSSQSPIQLEVATDMPGLQIYTGEYLPVSRGGIALEAQNFPDAINHAHFPSPILHEEEYYHQTIVWRVVNRD